jgi:PAS domain S-box-containing protein
MKASTTTKTSVPEFLSGGGELGQMIREYDWPGTSLGPIEGWPHSLRTCIRIMLTSRQPIWIGWGKELIKFYNDPYKTIVGGKHPWALGSPASIVWKDIWKDIEPLLRQVMENDEGTYVESQLLIMERNGYPEETYYTFSYTPIPGDDGGTAGMICANTDDTERIISERQLKTLTQLGARLTDSKSSQEIIKETISTLSDNHHDFPFSIFYSFAGNKALFAASTELGKGAKTVPKAVSIDTNSEFSRLLGEAISSRKIQVLQNLHGEMGVMSKGAWEVSSDKALILPVIQAGSKETYGFLVVGFNPYRLLDEKYSGFFSLITDQMATSFASVYLLEEQRKRAEALAEIDRAKTTFFSNISHEFRTPLTLLLGPIEDALNNPQAIGDNQVRLDVAYRNALRMQKLVNTLLEFSRIEAGRVEGKFTRVDIGALTEDLASTFRSAIEKAGMKLKIIKGDIRDEVYADIDMWEMIILNLVSNAFKYSKKGTIRIEVKQVAKELHVMVSDTGIGIPADQLEKIFSRFHRVENTEGRSQEGTGIGLAMVKELVRLHNGTISVNSKLGKGSVFTVAIPLGKEHLPAGKIIEAPVRATGPMQADAFVQEAMKWLPEERPQESGDRPASFPEGSWTEKNGRRKSKIVLADDNADMRDYVQRLLSDQYTVITAIDGEDAYTKIVQHRPALVLSDIMMPRLDGFGLLKKLRDHQDLRNTPVIFLSARAGEEAKVEGLDAGVDDYLVKPFSAKELIGRVTNHIRINQVRREGEQALNEQANAMPQLMWVSNREGEITYFNNRLSEFKGAERVGNGNWNWLGMTHPEDLKTLAGLWQQAIQLDAAFQHEHRLQMRDGSYRWHLSRGIPQKNEEGRVIKWFGTTTDIHMAKEHAAILEDEVRKRTQELIQLNITLQRSNDDLQQFAHVASHDLKEPVRKIKTYGNRLQDEYGESIPAKGKEFLGKIHHASNRIMSMIDGVLNYSTLNSSEQPVEGIDLNEIFADIEKDLELMIEQKKAVFQKRDLISIEGASVLIYQLFYNLVNNSLKFSKPDASPVISVTSEIIGQAGQDMVRIVIADNGIGFSQEYAEKIFNTFTRLNSKDKYEGTGLGLALCKKIVERHRGQISATAEKDKGAFFTVILPLRQDHISEIK